MRKILSVVSFLVLVSMTFRQLVKRGRSRELRFATTLAQPSNAAHGHHQQFRRRTRAGFSKRKQGPGCGSLAGVLIAAWLNHRQRVKIETEELTKELHAYHDAESDLLKDAQTMELEDQQSVTELQQLDPKRRADWNLQFQLSRKLYDAQAKYISDLKGLLEMQMKEKRRKALHYLVDHDPDGAKMRYGRQRAMAAQSYVVNQFLKALYRNPIGGNRRQSTKISPSIRVERGLASTGKDRYCGPQPTTQPAIRLARWIFRRSHNRTVRIRGRAATPRNPGSPLWLFQVPDSRIVDSISVHFHCESIWPHRFIPFLRAQACTY